MLLVPNFRTIVNRQIYKPHSSVVNRQRIMNYRENELLLKPFSIHQSFQGNQRIDFVSESRKRSRRLSAVLHGICVIELAEIYQRNQIWSNSWRSLYASYLNGVISCRQYTIQIFKDYLIIIWVHNPKSRNQST